MRLVASLQRRTYLSLLDLPEEKYPKPFTTDAEFERFFESECDPLAGGTTRIVRSVRGENFVVKKEKGNSAVHHNWLELAAWLFHVEDRSKIAGIVSCSRSGRYIVMEKLDASAKRPDKFVPPHWVTDAGSKNGGVDLVGDYKLFDYAFVKSPDEGYESGF